MSTQDDLQTAFAGESQANRKYTAFARKAEAEGYPQVAKLFRAAAHSETVHALAHLNVMGQVHSTEENLKAAIGGESYEHTNMYPGMIGRAEDEGHAAAITTFSNANEVEKIHDKLFSKALENISGLAVVDYYVCEVCGNTFEGHAPDTCPVCHAPGSRFTRID